MAVTKSGSDLLIFIVLMLLYAYQTHLESIGGQDRLGN